MNLFIKNIGSSENNIKLININYNIDISNYKIKLVANKFNDTFDFKIENNILIVTRTDLNTGWGYDHYVIISSNKENINMKDIKKIHLTCKDKNNISTSIYSFCLEKYKKIYNDYDIIVYDNNDIYEIIKKYFPTYLEKIKQIKIGAILADIFRYLILYLEGGIYSDMDCEPIQKIDKLYTNKYFHGTLNNNFNVYPADQKLINNEWDFYDNPCSNCKLILSDKIMSYECLGHDIGNASTILCYEYHKDWHSPSNWLNNNYTYNNVGICQWFIITEPNQEIFLNMFTNCIENIDLLIDFKKNDTDYHFNVVNTCGPLKFTKNILDNMTDKIHILPSDFFCAGSGCNSVPHTKNSYIKHHFEGSWLK